MRRWESLSLEEKNKFMGSREVFEFEQQKEASAIRPNPSGKVEADDVMDLAAAKLADVRGNQEKFDAWARLMFENLTEQGRADYAGDIDVWLHHLRKAATE